MEKENASPDSKEEVIIKIRLPRPMTFQEVFGIDPKKCRINWDKVKR